MNFSMRIPTSIVGTTIQSTFVENLLWATCSIPTNVVGTAIPTKLMGMLHFD